jgi:uncharacterized damage-inducible protein DinB
VPDLPDMLDHAIWADAMVVSAMEALPADAPERAQALRLYAHLAASAHVWLSRIEGRTPRHVVWPDLSLEAARALGEESLTGLRAWAGKDPDALASVIEYRTSTGQPFRNTVREVLTHVALHLSHHRGQIALLVRKGGGTPAATDYIFYARDRLPRGD